MIKVLTLFALVFVSFLQNIFAEKIFSIKNNIGISSSNVAEFNYNNAQIYASSGLDFNMKNFNIGAGIGAYWLDLKSDDNKFAIKPNLMCFSYLNGKILNFNIALDVNLFFQNAENLENNVKTIENKTNNTNASTNNLLNTIKSSDVAYSIGGKLGYDFDMLALNFEMYTKLRYFNNTNKQTISELYKFVEKITNHQALLDTFYKNNSIVIYGYGATSSIEFDKLKLSASIGIDHIHDKDFKGMFLTSHLIDAPFMHYGNQFPNNIKYCKVSIEYAQNSINLKLSGYLDFSLNAATASINFDIKF